MVDAFYLRSRSLRLFLHGLEILITVHLGRAGSRCIIMTMVQVTSIQIARVSPVFVFTFATRTNVPFHRAQFAHNFILDWLWLASVPHHGLTSEKVRFTIHPSVRLSYSPSPSRMAWLRGGVITVSGTCTLYVRGLLSGTAGDNRPSAEANVRLHHRQPSPGISTCGTHCLSLPKHNIQSPLSHTVSTAPPMPTNPRTQ